MSKHRLRQARTCGMHVLRQLRGLFTSIHIVKKIYSGEGTSLLEDLGDIKD